MSLSLIAITVDMPIFEEDILIFHAFALSTGVCISELKPLIGGVFVVLFVVVVIAVVVFVYLFVFT